MTLSLGSMDGASTNHRSRKPHVVGTQQENPFGCGLSRGWLVRGSSLQCTPGWQPGRIPGDSDAFIATIHATIGR
jgi:hypothetical protein